MAMFPLGSVLFPSMPLTLRIFEERYLKLLGDLMSSESPEFGVVLSTRTTQEAGIPGMSIGTIASVSDIGTTDDFLGLESVGSRRFLISEWLPDDPYPIAEIEFLPDLQWDDNQMPARVHLEKKVRQLLALVSELGELQFGPDIALSDDPLAACWQLAGILPVGELDRIDLLGAQSTEELLARTYEITAAAEDAVRAMLMGETDAGDGSV